MFEALASYILATVHSSALNFHETAAAKLAGLNRHTYADYRFVHQAYGSAASLRVNRSVRTLVFTTYPPGLPAEDPERLKRNFGSAPKPANCIFDYRMRSAITVIVTHSKLKSSITYHHARPTHRHWSPVTAEKTRLLSKNHQKLEV